MNDLQVRALLPADYDVLMTLWQRAGLSHRPEGRDSRENISAEMAQFPQNFQGLFIEGRLVASVLATFDGRKGWINRVAVDPDYRGRGYGRQMIATAERVLREHYGAQIIAALVEPENIPSINLFSSVGYHHWEGLHYFSKRDRPDV